MISGKTEHKQGSIDCSRLETAFANVFELLCSPGEIILAFGNIKSFDAEQENVLSADLTNRIFLSPQSLKRLSGLLNDKINQYEAAFGPLTKEVPGFSERENISSWAESLPYASERNAEKANGLMRLVEKLGVEFGFERSFKISDRSLLTNRFIMGLKKSDLVDNPDEMLLATFGRMGMPDAFQDDCRSLLDKTEFVHFGFEEQKAGCLYKAYLEFKLNMKLGPDGAKVKHEPVLVFLGFKWDPFDDAKRAVSRYICHPLLSVAEIQEKLASLFNGNREYKSFETARNILEQTVKIISNNKIIYEEVTEENNSRKSFDMNLYAANLCIRDIYPLLMEIGRHYSLPAERFVPLCDRISDKRFGHLSGGVDREGKDFLTVYYGVEGIDARNLNRV